MSPDGDIVFVQQVLDAEGQFANRERIAADKVYGIVAVELITAGIAQVEYLLSLHAQRPRIRCPADPGGGFGRRSESHIPFLPATVTLHLGFQHVEVCTCAPVAIREEVIDGPFHTVNTPLVGLYVDRHIGTVNNNGFVRGGVVCRQLGTQIIAGVTPAQFVGVDFDPLQRRITHVDTRQQGIVAVDRRAVFADTIVFTRVRQLDALREVKPGLLAVGEVGDNTGVKQEVIIIRFTTRDGIGRVHLAAGDILLLGVADKIINPVFRPLIAHAAAQGENIIQVITTLQERRQVCNAIARITSCCIDRLVVQAA